jgi:4-amino-4-deoxy-L-arabinose transferase-like glycosyltransferase
MASFLVRRWRWVLGPGVLGALALLIVLCRPWLATCHVPVQARFRAPDADAATLAWGDGADERVALVPLKPDATAEERAGVRSWVGVLPPVPIQRLRLEVADGKDFAFAELVLRRDQDDAAGPLQRLTAADVQVEADGGRAVVCATAPLAVNQPLGDVVELGKYWLAPGLLLALCALAAVYCLRGGAAAPRPSLRTPQGLRLIGWLCLLITAGYVIHSQAMPACYTGGDSNWFLWKGGNIAEHLRFETRGEYQFELCKLPGYSFVYAVVIRVVGYNLSALILVQTLAYCLSLYLLGRACLHFASKWIVALGLLVIAASPIQLYYCITVMSESMMVSCMLIALACLLELGAAGGRTDWGWLMAFALAVGAGSMMRSNAVFLGAALFPLYLFLARARRLSWWGLSLRTVVAGALIALPLTAWSARNYYSRQVLEPQHMKGIMLFQGACVGGAVEPRAPSFAPYYAEFSRLASQPWYSPWNLRTWMFEKDPARDPDPQANMHRVERTLCAFVAESAAAHRGVYVAAQTRALYENVWQPPVIDRTGEARNNPHCWNYPTAPQCQQFVRDVKFSSPHCVYDVRGAESFGARFFRKWNLTYIWYYRALLLGALAAGFWSLASRRAHPLLFIPILLVGVNVLFVTYLIMPYGRYIQVFDCVLALQIVFAFSTLRKAKAQAAPKETPAVGAPVKAAA